MTVGISTYLANKLLDHALRGVTYTPPTTIYAKAHLSAGDPGSAGTSNPSTQTTRSAVTYAAAASGAVTLSSTPEFVLTATETIGYLSYWDHPTAGNFLFSGAAGTPKSGVAGDIIRISTSTHTLGPLAA